MTEQELLDAPCAHHHAVCAAQGRLYEQPDAAPSEANVRTGLVRLENVIGVLAAYGSDGTRWEHHNLDLLEVDWPANYKPGQW